MSEIEFMKCMKILQETFMKDFEEDTLMVWYSHLKNCRYELFLETVNKIAKEKTKLPSIKELLDEYTNIRDNKQLKEKQNEDFIVACRWCNKKMPLSVVHQHESRHLSVRYIESRMLKYIHKQLSKEQIQQFMELEEDKFQEWYDDFLEKLIPLVENREEKERLEKIKETRHN